MALKKFTFGIGKTTQDVELPDMTNAWTIASQNRKELQIMEDQLAIAGYQKKTTAAAQHNFFGIG